MRRWSRLGIGAVAVAALGCSEPNPDEETCGELCDQLVNVCDYAAYPDLDSCLQGCLYNASVGADVEGQNDCTFLAQCDAFEIVECEHQYGPAQG